MSLWDLNAWIGLALPLHDCNWKRRSKTNKRFLIKAPSKFSKMSVRLFIEKRLLK